MGVLSPRPGCLCHPAKHPLSMCLMLWHSQEQLLQLLSWCSGVPIVFVPSVLRALLDSGEILLFPSKKKKKILDSWLQLAIII